MTSASLFPALESVRYMLYTLSF